MKRLPLLGMLILCVPGLLAAKPVKLRGYVTNLLSPTSFEIEDYRITRDASLVLDFEKDEDTGNLSFQPDELRVGTLLEIKGELDEKIGELRAQSIKVILEDFKKIKRTALIEKSPGLARTPDGWLGAFFADGQRVHVDASTKVFFKPNKTEKDKLKAQEKKSPPVPAPKEGEDLTPLASLDQVGPNTFMTYEGLRQLDGSILASRVEFLHNELEKGEANMWKSLKVNVKASNFLEGKPGELKIEKIGKFKLVPNEQAQQYLRELGERLIPPFQKSLSAGDPNKIPFQFYLVEGKQANAFATPNGIVVVFSPMFKILENEAQLAAVMSHEISHSVQEHAWRQHEYHKQKLMALKIGAAIGAAWGGGGVMDIANMIEGAVRNGYSRSLENQADRTSLQYMLAAGYDIREAPRVWKLMTKEYGDRPTDFFWSSHDNHTTRRSYLMAEIHWNYAHADFSGLQKNQDRYGQIAELVKNASPKARVKVKY
jgi:hypothetical protein